MTPWWLWCTWLGPYGDASEWCAWGWTVIICSFLVFVWFHAHILSCEVLPEAQNTVFQMKTFKLWSFITIWSYQPSTLQVCIRICSGNWICSAYVHLLLLVLLALTCYQCLKFLKICRKCSFAVEVFKNGRPPTGLCSFIEKLSSLPSLSSKLGRSWFVKNSDWNTQFLSWLWNTGPGMIFKDKWG